MRFKTYTPTIETTAVERSWYVIDAAGLNLGRLASRVAHLLRGKHKTTFAPHQDTGDFVIILNAEQITVTGDRLNEKLYRRHSQYPGGFKEVSMKDMMRTHPERVVEMAIKGMLPHNRIGRQMFRKLHVYKGTNHPHQAQKPIVFEVPEAKKLNG